MIEEPGILSGQDRPDQPRRYPVIWDPGLIAPHGLSGCGRLARSRLHKRSFGRVGFLVIENLEKNQTMDQQS